MPPLRPGHNASSRALPPRLPHKTQALSGVCFCPCLRIDALRTFRRITGWWRLWWRCWCVHPIADGNRTPAATACCKVASKLAGDCAPVGALAIGAKPSGQIAGRKMPSPPALLAFHHTDAAHRGHFIKVDWESARHRRMCRNGNGTPAMPELPIGIHSRAGHLARIHPQDC